MRVLALHADVIVFVSRVWQTTCTAVRAGDEGFLIDSPVYPDELEAVPGVLEQAGFAVSGLVATHADWDHLLGRLAFPQAALGCGEASVKRLAVNPGEPQRELRRFDEEHYVRRSGPLALAGVQELPVPGRLDLGADAELELHPADGHTSDGLALLIPWARVLVCGDYLSPVEIPMISEGGSASAYLATLERLAPLVERVETVVPGHGGPIAADATRKLLAEDEAYVRALREQGAMAQLPPTRRSEAQRQIHRANAERVA